jgi:hypothetical protein
MRVGQEAIRQLPGPPDRRRIVAFQTDVLGVCFLVSVCSLSSDGASEWVRSAGGAQIPVARSPGLQNFVRWALIFLDPQ